MRAVVDTVVFVRALINPAGPAGRLLVELPDRYVIVLSPEIVREILEVLYRPSLRQRFPQIVPPPLEQVLALIEEAEVVEPRDHVKVCRDPAGDKFFACALAGGADYIVSEDNDILAVGSYEGVKTIGITDFIAVLAGGGPAPA